MANQMKPIEQESFTNSNHSVKDSLIYWFAERATQDEAVKELLVEFLNFAESQQRVEKGQ